MRPLIDKHRQMSRRIDIMQIFSKLFIKRLISKSMITDVDYDWQMSQCTVFSMLTFFGLPLCFGPGRWAMLACCCMMWYRNLSDLEKLFGHSVHMNGRSPVCVLWCRCKCDSLKNDNLQYMHWCGFSPECVCMWRLRFCLFRNVRWHVGHSTVPVRLTLVWASINAWKSIWDGWYLGCDNMVGFVSSVCSSIITCGLSMFAWSNGTLLSDESSSHGTWNIRESDSAELTLPLV